MSAQMDARLADLALRMATVFSMPPEWKDQNPSRPGDPDHSLLREDLPQLAEAMLVLALRMLDPILAALQHLASGTPQAGPLQHWLGKDAQEFASHRVQVSVQDGRLMVSGCEAVPLAFLPWIASNLVGAGALLVPRPFSDPDTLRRHIGETLLRIERLTTPGRSEGSEASRDLPKEANGNPDRSQTPVPEASDLHGVQGEDIERESVEQELSGRKRKR